MSTFAKVEDSIKYLMEDHMTPRTVREKLTRMLQYLQRTDQDAQTKISTVLSEIEDMSSDVNIPPFVRTNLYGIASRLEEIGNNP